MEREVGFDIEDTWLYMGLLAQREEAEVTRYIQAKRGQAVLSGQDVAAVEIATVMRSTLR